MKLQRVVTNWRKSQKIIVAIGGVAVVMAAIANAQRIGSFIRWVQVGHRFNQGVVLALNGYENLAVLSFTRAIAIEPSFIEAYEHRGNAHLAMEDYESAIADLLKAAPTSDEKEQLSLSLGDAYFALGDTTNALNHYSTALDISPDLAGAHIGEGNVYYQQQNYWRALEKFEHALDINKKLLDARWGKAVVQWQMLGSDESETALSSVLADIDDPLARPLQPDDDEVYLSIGKIEYGKGNYQIGHQLAAKAIEIDAENPLAYVLKGVAYSDKGEHELALEAYDKVSRLLTIEAFGIGVFLSRDETTKAMKIDGIVEETENSSQSLTPPLKEGDIILSINKQPISAMTAPQIKSLLKGEENSPVQLRIDREGEGEIIVDAIRRYSLTQFYLTAVSVGRTYSYKELGNGAQAIAICEQFDKTEVEDAYSDRVCGEVHQLFGEKKTAIRYFQDSIGLYTELGNEDDAAKVKKMLAELE